MKKELIIVIVIIVLIIIGHICTQNYTKNFFDSLLGELKNIENQILVDNINGEDLKKDIDNLQEKWESKYDVLAYYIEHDELEKVETQLIAVKANIEVEEYEKAVEEVQRCMFILEHIKDKDALKLVNIF